MTLIKNITLITLSCFFFFYRQRYGASAPRQVARARKEIVLSAGAIFSPHILMLSGIGPAKNLVAFNITVVSGWRVE